MYIIYKYNYNNYNDYNYTNVNVRLTCFLRTLPEGCDVLPQFYIQIQLAFSLCG